MAPVLCAAALLLLGWRLVDGLSFVSFMDEATHVLGGKVLDRGGLLYRDFVDTHGPLVFALAQGYGALFGWSDANGTRVTIALCAVLSVLSLALSPTLSPAARDRGGRACGLILGAGLLAAVWLRQGLYLFSFYPLGGALASVALGGFVAGACFGRVPRGPHAFAAGAALSLLGGTAYSFGPCIAAWALAGLWAAVAAGQRRASAWFGGGMLFGAAALLLYLRRFADLHGYLSYHLAENQLVYARYIDFGWRRFLAGLLPSSAPEARAQTVGMLCWLLSLAGLWAPSVRRGPFALLLLGTLSLNARGSTNFQDGSFLWAAIALLALTAMALTAMALPGERGAGSRSIPPALMATACALLVGSALLFLRGASYMPFALPARTLQALPRWRIGDRSDAPFFAAIRGYARPGEPILGLLYQPQLYLLADRLPPDGFYAWFPWDQRYEAVARFGRTRDLCAALRERPPPVIVLDPTPFWGHDPMGVAPCLPAVLQRDYQVDSRIRDIHGTLFVRRDRFGTEPDSALP